MAIENLPKNLDEFRALTASDKLVVIDFYATWCGPCKLISPKFEKLVEEYPDVIFAKVDVDEVADVAADVGVRAMPTFMFFKNGNKVDEVVGANLASIVNKIKQNTA
ncbi:thioredoxin TrxA [Halteromyces radiatus]|uniref:thioredoxin TrxA n=1 Tax=Halteromyces radiatus TaxID=101107 RepID=UPI002220A360|nr:thioredoxin TrxA [Halteromyces radiatus]KAI8084549.1 thioredoxin TrxA [Halteromyces radiatus]